MIEYRNVLQVDRNNAAAIRQLGFAHYHLGEVSQGFRFLLKAQELETDNLEVRLKLGAIYLLGQRREQAQAEAEFILERDPRSRDGLLLLAGVANTPEQVAGAIRRLEGVRAESGQQAGLHIALANLYLRKQDLPGAERALEAVTREPRSVEAYLALGQLYALKHDPARAEQAFRTAADLAPAGSRLAPHGGDQGSPGLSARVAPPRRGGLHRAEVRREQQDAGGRRSLGRPAPRRRSPARKRRRRSSPSSAGADAGRRHRPLSGLPFPRGLRCATRALRS